MTRKKPTHKRSLHEEESLGDTKGKTDSGFLMEGENNIKSNSSNKEWKNFDLDKFFKETDAVGKIIERGKKESED